MKVRERGDASNSSTLINQMHLTLDNEILKLTKEDDLILDIGCGEGFDMLYLSTNKRIVVGLDYSISQLRLAEKTFREQDKTALLVRGDIQHLPFKPKSFDFVYSVLVMQYFKDLVPLIEEQKRVLKKDKWLAIYVTHRYSVYTIVKHFCMLLGSWRCGWDRGQRYCWETEYSLKEIINLLRESGFRVVASWGSGLDIFLSVVLYPERTTRLGGILPPRIIYIYRFFISPLRLFIEKSIEIIRKQFPTAAATSIGVIGALEEENR